MWVQGHKLIKKKAHEISHFLTKPLNPKNPKRKKKREQKEQVPHRGKKNMLSSDLSATLILETSIATIRCLSWGHQYKIVHSAKLSFDQFIY